MGVTKMDLYDVDELELAAWAKALGHPARIAIIRYLLKSKTCVNGDLTDEIGLSQPTISQHLKELKNAGFIQGTVSGTSINYCINPEKWNLVSAAFQAFFGQFCASDNPC